MPNDKLAHLKAKARELRQQGYTLTEITEFLKLPKTTIYGWIRDIEVDIKHYRSKHDPEYSDAKRERDRQNSARYAAKRDAFYQRGLEEAPELLKNPLFRDFVVIYIGEGTKAVRSYVALVNSRAAVMQLGHHWIKKFANPDNRIDYAVQIHIDHDENEIKQYWAKVLDIQPEQIVVMRKSNSNQLTGRKFRSEHGVLQIRASDTYFRSRLLGWIDYLEKQWMDFKPE